MKKYSWILFCLVAMVACKNDTKKTETEEVIEETKEVVVEKAEEVTKTIGVQLEAKSGSSATGMVSITESKGVVLFEAKISGLDPGVHAIHLHEKADCSSEDGKSSGGHWNPTHEDHGKWGAESGYHKGDIGNFEVGADGVGKVSFSTDEWCIGCEDEKKDILGKAIIVHQGADDFTSQPSGAAGARVSCGGVIQ